MVGSTMIMGLYPKSQKSQRTGGIIILVISLFKTHPDRTSMWLEHLNHVH